MPQASCVSCFGGVGSFEKPHCAGPSLASPRAVSRESHPAIPWAMACFASAWWQLPENLPGSVNSSRFNCVAAVNYHDSGNSESDSPFSSRYAARQVQGAGETMECDRIAGLTWPGCPQRSIQILARHPSLSSSTCLALGSPQIRMGSDIEH